MFIETYYDKKLIKNYIIACTDKYSISYDYNKNEIYRKYLNDNNKTTENINSIVINNKEEIVKLIESSYEGNIRIWDFHAGFLLKIIKVKNNGLREISLWDNKYLFVGCDDKTIKLINYKDGIIIKELKGHNDKVVSIKKIMHPQYGKCLISQGAELDSIKLWTIKY